MRELGAERETLLASVTVMEHPPRIEAARAMEYRGKVAKILKQGEMLDPKRLLRAWVDKMTMAPESGEVEIRYRLPEPLVKSVVAGGGFEPPTSGL